MSFQQSASYVKATGGSSRIDLPVVNMEVTAEPIVPDGGTAQEDYDQYMWFQTPSFRLNVMLEWGFERTDARPSFLNTLRDLISQYMNGNGPLDLYVKYTGDPLSYVATDYDPNYYCPSMIPDMDEDDAGLIFSEQAREKERKIMLRSKSSDLTWDQVKFTFD